ncbi:hypothetical protein DFJ73DRAFT_761158 [Zopfochytrium polystomum]|nr:hypothetical protein DFJ73DRAFT_761158 [Zopfochytrium polystomum]
MTASDSTSFSSSLAALAAPPPPPPPPPQLLQPMQQGHQQQQQQRHDLLLYSPSNHPPRAKSSAKNLLLLDDTNDEEGVTTVPAAALGDDTAALAGSCDGAGRGGRHLAAADSLFPPPSADPRNGGSPRSLSPSLPRAAKTPVRAPSFSGRPSQAPGTNLSPPHSLSSATLPSARKTASSGSSSAESFSSTGQRRPSAGRHHYLHEGRKFSDPAIVMIPSPLSSTSPITAAHFEQVSRSSQPLAENLPPTPNGNRPDSLSASDGDVATSDSLPSFSTTRISVSTSALTTTTTLSGSSAASNLLSNEAIAHTSYSTLEPYATGPSYSLLHEPPATPSPTVSTASTTDGHVWVPPSQWDVAPRRSKTARKPIMFERRASGSIERPRSADYGPLFGSARLDASLKMSTIASNVELFDHGHMSPTRDGQPAFRVPDLDELSMDASHGSSNGFAAGTIERSGSSRPSLATEKETQKFAKLFPEFTSEGDAVLASYTCAFERDGLWQGRLYLISSHALFFGHLSEKEHA